MCIVLCRLSLTLVIRNITSPNSPGRIHTRACRCSWRPPTGSGSVRSGTYLHESTPLWPRTWASLSHGPCKGAKRNNVPAETRSTAETASTTCRPPKSRESPARTRVQSWGGGSELSPSSWIGRCVLRSAQASMRVRSGCGKNSRLVAPRLISSERLKPRRADPPNTGLWELLFPTGRAANPSWDTVMINLIKKKFSDSLQALVDGGLARHLCVTRWPP